jgi:hypothetical protein
MKLVAGQRRSRSGPAELPRTLENFYVVPTHAPAVKLRLKPSSNFSTQQCCGSVPRPVAARRGSWRPARARPLSLRRELVQTARTVEIGNAGYAAGVDVCTEVAPLSQRNETCVDVSSLEGRL